MGNFAMFRARQVRDSTWRARIGAVRLLTSMATERSTSWSHRSAGPRNCGRTPAPANHWIILRLVGERSNRDGIGARICIGDQWNHMTTAVSYASSSDFGVHFGLGATRHVGKIEIRWPSGAVQVLTDVNVDQVLEVHEPKA